MTAGSRRGGGESPKSKRTTLEKWLALITGLAALVSAGLGVVAAEINVEKNKAQTAADSKGADLSTLQDENSRLKQKNQQLESENNSLRAQPGSTDAPVEPQANSAVKPRHTGPLVMTSGSKADLDAPQSQPQWNLQGGDAVDLSFDNNFGLYSSALLDLHATIATYDNCRNSGGGYGSGYLSPRDFAAGDNLCVKTSDQRYAALRVSKLDKNEVAFAVVTYDPPGE